MTVKRSQLNATAPIVALFALVDIELVALHHVVNADDTLTFTLAG